MAESPGDPHGPEQGGTAAAARGGTARGAAWSKVVLASGNPHKLEELRRALPGFRIESVGRDDPPPEDGATYVENARIKARWGRSHVQADSLVVGEDSGIEAVALDGAPGVRTARWAAGDAVGRILEALSAEDERRARYVCVMVAIAPDGREFVAEGALDGRIARVASGIEGFGFDPVFVPEGENETVAVLGNAWKQTHSHRARAASALRGLLEA